MTTRLLPIQRCRECSHFMRERRTACQHPRVTAQNFEVPKVLPFPSGSIPDWCPLQKVRDNG